METDKTSAHAPKDLYNPPITDGVRDALAVLKRALDYASEAEVPPWDFAIEIGHFYAVGLTITDLRWMVAKRFIEHADETSAHGDEHRSFTPSRGFNFSPTTCVLLTKEGARFAASSEVTSPEETIRASVEPDAEPSLKPHWDASRRVLSLSGRLVKQFHAPARNQELILSAFQKNDWPEFIHDPLADDFAIDPKVRLNDVVYRLNRKQIVSLLRFHVNGHGHGHFHGVHWSLNSLTPRRQLAHAGIESLAVEQTRVVDG
jgi:hypothetical protein